MKFILFILGPLGWLAACLVSSRPEWVERYYSEEFYRFIISPLSMTTAWASFSVGEIIVVLTVIFMIGMLIWIPLNIFRGKMKRAVLREGKFLALFLSVGYFLFVLCWGLNYYREPFDKIAGLEIKQGSEKELFELSTELIQEANYLRRDLPEDGQGVMSLGEERQAILESASEGFSKTAEQYKQLNGEYGPVKPVYFSKALSYMGITGIYFPFTGEANINTDIPDLMIPSTACHEMAHQRGFAKEDEANYISYLVCRANHDQRYKYSGIILALTYSMNALNEQNPDMAFQLRKLYSPGLYRDLTDITAYWQQYEGLIERWSTKLNDRYLKSNRQQQGVISYGKVVDLLLADRRMASTNL